MIPLLFLVGIGMHTAWRSQPEGTLWRVLRVPAAIAVTAGLLLPYLAYGSAGPLLIVGSMAAFWLMANALLLPLRSLRRRPGAAPVTRSALGMSVAHFGVGLFVLGVTFVSTFSIESDQALSPGQFAVAGDYRFEMRELLDVDGPNYIAREAVVDVRRYGEFVGQVRPQKRQYQVQQSWMTEAGILEGWNRDLLISMGDPIDNDTWSVRVQYKPLIRFIWLGEFIMAFGGLLSATDRRYRAPAAARVRTTSTGTVAAEQV
jgi:cytochrome c-type biogenesis protein CcmF